MSFAASAVAVVQGDQARRQGKRMEDATNASNLMQSDMYYQQREDQAPWRQAGGAALANLMAGFGQKLTMPENYGLSDHEAQLVKNYKQLLGTPIGQGSNAYANEWRKQLDALTGKSTSAWGQANPAATMDQGWLSKDFSLSDFETDPGYQFRMDEGRKAMERSAAARGGLNSGGFAKSLERYSQGVASDEYNNAFNRFNANRDSRFNRLASLAGMGQTATAQIGQAGQNYANAYGQNIQAGANARAAGSMAGTNALVDQFNRMQNTAAQVGGIMMCDERLKENISPVSRADILEFKKAVKPKLFTYIDSDHGEGDFVGPMAQDIEGTRLGRLIVRTNSGGQKYIDFNRAVMLLLALEGEGV